MIFGGHLSVDNSPPSSPTSSSKSCVWLQALCIGSDHCTFSNHHIALLTYHNLYLIHTHLYISHPPSTSNLPTSTHLLCISCPLPQHPTPPTYCKSAPLLSASNPHPPTVHQPPLLSVSNPHPPTVHQPPSFQCPTHTHLLYISPPPLSVEPSPATTSLSLPTPPMYCTSAPFLMCPTLSRNYQPIISALNQNSKTNSKPICLKHCVCLTIGHDYYRQVFLGTLWILALYKFYILFIIIIIYLFC